MRSIKKSYFWGLYAIEKTIGYSSVPLPPPPAREEPKSVEMCIVGINREYPGGNTSIDLVPQYMRPFATGESEYSTLQFKLGQVVKISIVDKDKLA